MRTLYHYPLCPLSRHVRLHLAEKKLDVTLTLEYPWDAKPHLLEKNHTGDVPLFVEHQYYIVQSYAISEYIEETHPENSLLGTRPAARAEARRLMQWFHGKMYYEATYPLLYEKLLKRFLGHGGPDSAMIRHGMQRSLQHLSYIQWLVDRRTWLAGEQLSLADLAAAAQISTLDYLGAITWKDYPIVQDWYARMKSRPSFQPLLQDRIAAIVPPAHYADLDF